MEKIYTLECGKDGIVPAAKLGASMRPRQESNLCTWLRRPTLYPLSYEGFWRASRMRKAHARNTLSLHFAELSHCTRLEGCTLDGFGHLLVYIRV